ncbi:MAG: ribonuclease E/G [Pseudomonadota bacterium]
MKGHVIILDHIGARRAAALLVDGQLDDFLIDGDTPRPGTIYRAVPDRAIKGQGGMFLKTPDGQAFLRRSKGVSPGKPVLVQVTGYAEPGKAIPVTDKVLFKSRYAIVTPDAPGINVSRAIKDEERRDQLLALAHDVTGEDDFGLILRSACHHAEEADIAGDIAAMRRLAAEVVAHMGAGPERLLEGDDAHLTAWREWITRAQIVTTPGAFAKYDVLSHLEAIKIPSVALEGGAYMIIEPTSALVAVDVNTGQNTSLAAALKANLSCAKALPRALRLRGLGGQITIDLAPMPKKDRRAFETALRTAFRSDLVETALVGWTPLGHYELQRKRVRPKAADLLI